MAAVEPISTLPGQNNAFAYSEIIHQMVFDFNFLFPCLLQYFSIYGGGALFNIYMDADAKGLLGQQCKVWKKMQTLGRFAVLP